MEKKEILDKLSSLMKLDIDAVFAYKKAIEKIDMADVRQELMRFRDDHERHVHYLGDSIREFGGTPPEYSKDFKDFFIEAFTSARSAAGTEGVLDAIKRNEELTNREYREAAQLDFPLDVKGLIEKNYDDEKKHMAYIEMAIRNEICKKVPAR